MRNTFNLLRPLTHPAGARRQLIGVSDAGFLDTIAGALARLGVEHALVVAGEDGLDERSTAAATKVVEVQGEEISRYTVAPQEVGVEPADAADFERDCAGGEPVDDAQLTRAILAGDTASLGRPGAGSSPCSTRARRSTPAAARTRSPTGSRLRARPSRT